MFKNNFHFAYHYKAFASGLKTVYQASTEEAALMALDVFAGARDEKYPQISKN